MERQILHVDVNNAFLSWTAVEMLKQGRTKKSVELLKMVDVDLESKKPYEDAINFYKKNIEELKEILK